MAKYVVIVESPAKTKTLKKFLGKDYSILASYGHVRDLLPKEGSVDPNHDFEMKYAALEKNTRHMQAIAKALKPAEHLYLATDPDREGEAISWHVYELLKEKKALQKKKVRRVVFHEITEPAIKHAIANPRELSMDLVNAQQARRALDYLVGFNLSPLLWKKIRRGLSAGRVQSPALRLIVEREEAIDKFETQEYWSITAECDIDKQAFNAKLIIYQDEKLQQFSINNEKQAKQVTKTLIKKADGKLLVSKVEKKQRKRNPAAPFITSTLQQEAARKLGFSAKRTMILAQQLYEGIEVGTNTVGLISYMRTDSVHLADEAVKDIRRFVSKRYGKDQIPESPRVYKTKTKNAQEAHEAIRPTSVQRTPEQVKMHLDANQLKLYELIWKRTVASQMIHATIDTVAVDLQCGKEHTFRANGSTIVDPGFMAVYLEDEDDSKLSDKDERLLPTMKENDVVNLLDIIPAQHFTEPPPRYTEASLVKALEEHGIGRPSTYASIIDTLQYREYAILEKKRFIPTDVGRIVNRFLTQYFEKYVDYEFTAHLEDELDAISRGEKQWVPVLEKFWKPFDRQVRSIDKKVQRSDVTTEPTDEKCPKCGKPLAIRLGKRGRFIGCTGFPDCDYTANVDGSGEESTPEDIGRDCPKCSSALQIRHGPYGKFIGCSGYPNCRYLEPLNKPKDTGVECPECHQGSMVERRSRRGKIFFSCAKYPDCTYAVWNLPIDEACPDCAWPMLTLKVTKSRGEEKVCPRKTCGFATKNE